MEPILHRFHHNTAIFIRNDPVKLCRRKLITEWDSCQIHFLKCCFCFFHGRTSRKDPWDKLILGYILFFFCFLCITCIPHKIQASHTKTFFIGCIIVKRISARHMCHTDHCIMLLHHTGIMKVNGIVPRHHGNLFSIRKFIIQSTSHIEIFCLIGCCCTHINPPIGSADICPHLSGPA